VVDGSALRSVKRVLVGAPIPARLARHERFSRVTGLAVLSSDALSSVAYATEEILRTLVAAGAAALWLTTPIAGVIAVLLLVVVFSYRQTIHAYPDGGGAYRVAKENIGLYAGLVSAAALLVDYVLTVSVSVAAGVAALTSAFPGWLPLRVELALVFLAVLTVGNLRGVRESGRLFALPTYFFIVVVLGLIGTGLWKLASGATVSVATVVAPPSHGFQALTLFLVLRAFSNGCTAMTGVEAVSNGVSAFRPPESRNAVSTLLVMAALSWTMFLGITVLVQSYGIVPLEQETVISQLARAVFGNASTLYYAVQAATMLILVLAANTAFSDFPRLSSIVARDRFLPRQLTHQGDRLAFSNGILALSVLAGLLIVAFRGDTHRLIPLYMIGVFVSFTLSQAGMVLKWRRERCRGWRSSALLNGLGAVLTAIVLVVVAITKFEEGAWIVVLLVPALVALFLAIRRHYDDLATTLSLDDFGAPARIHRHRVLIPVSSVHRGTLAALHYARSLSDDVTAVHVAGDESETAAFRQAWTTWGDGVRLVVVESPFRDLLPPLLRYIETIAAKRQRHETLTIVVPQFVPRRSWHNLLHSQTAAFLRLALLFRSGIVITSVPYQLTRTPLGGEAAPS
jgi:amino acid transporter